MQNRKLIALVGIPESGLSAISSALSKEIGEVASTVELGDEPWHIQLQGTMPDLFIFVETLDATSKQEQMREKMTMFTDQYNLPFLIFKNDTPGLDLALNIPVLNSYVSKIIAELEKLPEKIRQYWENEFEECRDDGHFTWAMSDPMALHMFFKKTREKSIPLSVASITSMIARCIENNLSENLLRQILEFSKSMNVTGHLYLRRVSNINHLILASSYGFHDPELTKRIIAVQRKVRNQESPATGFSGRKPGESTEYYGYRHAMYFVRYNPQHRLKLFEHADYGDCNWQAYADLTGDEIPREVCEEMKSRRLKR